MNQSSTDRISNLEKQLHEEREQRLHLQAVLGPAFNEIKLLREKLDAWRLLDDVLPDVPIWDMWDRCARLRGGLIQSFIRFDWPREYFLVATAQDELLRKFASAYYSKRSYRRFVNQIEDIASGRQ